MSNTKKVFAAPLYSTPTNSEVDNLDLTGQQVQNPNDTTEDPNAAGSDTPTDAGTATSGSTGDVEYKKRYVDLKRYHDTKVHELRQELSALQQQASSTFTPPKNEEELEAFKRDNPEMFAMMQSVAMQNRSGVDEDRFNKMEQELEEARQREAIVAIKQAHPDYYDVVSSQAFTDWIEAQPETIQNLVVDNTSNSSSFIRALDLYKLDTGKTTADKGTSTEKSNIQQQSAADAVITPGSSNTTAVGETEGRIWTREEISKLKPQEFAMFEDDIDAAWREGRVR